MLVKKNKAREAMEKVLGFGFEELEFVGKYNNIIDDDFVEFQKSKLNIKKIVKF